MSLVVPVGHSKGHSSRYAWPASSELERVFLEWHSRVESTGSCSISIDRIVHSLSRLPDSSFTTDGLHELVLKYSHDSYPLLGAFVSGGYTKLHDNVIVYDLEAVVANLGCGLPRDKLLVNRGTVGEDLGLSAMGTVVNLGVTGNRAGFLLTGTLLSAGTAGHGFGCLMGAGIAVAFRDPDSYWADQTTTDRFVCHDSITGELQDYSMELMEICRGPVKGIYDRYGEVPAVTIRQDISRLLGVDP